MAERSMNDRPVFAAFPWPSNAELIAAVWRPSDESDVREVLA